MDDFAIKVEGLSKVYKLYNTPTDRLKEALNPFKKKYHHDFYALNNIGFEIKKGEIIGIVGKNGSGKSTLLKIITGVLTPTIGKVIINGKIAALLELGAGFNPEFTGMQNIYLNGTMMGFSHKEIEERIPAIIKFADIGEFINQPIKIYSSGMFVRLAFAVAINVKPDILIVDEILAVGDLNFQLKCINKMKEMMGGGTTVLFVSHDTNSIKRFCKRAIWINSGEIKLDGDTDRVTDAYVDFLKVGSEEAVFNFEKVNSSIKPFEKNFNIIAEVQEVNIYNSHGDSVNEISINERVIVEVLYDVYDENIENPVLGIAIRGIDEKYICGLNTLLDNVKIPWQEGRNRFYLEYTYGILTIGGKYYMDVALFEQTATIPIQYKSRIRNFEVISKYVGEGLLVIPHRWNNFENIMPS